MADLKVGDSGGESFGGLLRRYRGARGLTQEELADRAGLNVYAISLLERGVRRKPRSTTVEFLAGALKLDAAERELLEAAARRSAGPGADRAAISPDLQMPGTALIGREEEMTQVRALLSRADVRLLTLTGPPGSGKTRLALELATELAPLYRDGVVTVALGPLGDPGLVMPAIRRGLGLRETGNETPTETVARCCRERHLLLVLDNFEHLLAAASELVVLLARCPDLQALVTSRALLRVRMERELPVFPLALPTADQERVGAPPALSEVASVRLFLERVELAVHGFRLSAENARAVAAICRRLDGLPLALELAAPWMKLLTPEEMLERLDDRLDLLVNGPRDLPERQRTLRAALTWSCDLLEEGPRALLRRLSVFAGGAPLDALERVCRAAGLQGGMLRHLGSLVEHSLVQWQEAATGREARVTTLESVREYMREELAAAGEQDSAAEEHLAYYGTLAVRAAREMGGGEQAAWLERLEREHDNVRAALGWAAGHDRVEAGLRLAGELSHFWDWGGHRQEGLSWLERLLPAEGQVTSDVRARALMAAGSIASRLGSYDLSVARYEESLRISRDVGDTVGIADSLRGMAYAIGRRGDRTEAVHLLEEAVSLSRSLGNRPLLMTTLISLAGFLVPLEPRRAAELHEEALAIAQSDGDALNTLLCLVNLGDVAVADGDLELARARLEEAVSIARRINAPYHLGAALDALGCLALARGDPGAGTHLLEGLAIFVRIGDAFGVAVCSQDLGRLAWKKGLSRLAARLYGSSSALSPFISATQHGAQSAAHEEACAALRRQLGDDTFNAAFTAGGRLSMEETLDEASELTA